MFLRRARTRLANELLHSAGRLGQCWIVAIVMMISVPAASSIAFAQPAKSTPEFQLDIPSQPLAGALRAYGEVTGLEVFYDGSLAVGRNSRPVKGTFTSMRGLEVVVWSGKIASRLKYAWPRGWSAFYVEQILQ
jgi:hypothetical protein